MPTEILWVIVIVVALAALIAGLHVIWGEKST